MEKMKNGYDCAKFLESVDWSKLPVHPGEFDDDADYEAQFLFLYVYCS